MVKKTKKKEATQDEFNNTVLETINNVHENVKLIGTKLKMHNDKFDQRINALEAKVQKLANRVGIV